MSTAPGETGPATAALRKIVTASSVGTLVEWYDFYIYGSLAVIFSGYFFPKGNDAVALLVTVAAFGTGFVIRPLYQATEAGFRAARPGATCADVFTAMQREIDEAGFAANTIGRMGHGLGMQLTEWPSHRISDDTPLTPGMVITLEPALSIASGRGMVHEEDLVVRDGEPELLTTRARREIPELA